MSGNGCRIVGIVTITARPQTAAHGKEMAPSESFGAVPGPYPPMPFVLRFA